MRNAAMVLGVIAGVIGIFIGFFSYGYTEAINRWGEIEGLAVQVDRVELIRFMAVVAPLLALTGGAMAKMRALWGGVLLIASAAGMYWAFGWNVFTMFPVAMAALAGALALAAGKPDEAKAHF